MREIQQKTATKRGESIAHLKSPVPSIDIKLYNDSDFPYTYSDIILHRADGRRECITMTLIEEEGLEKLWSGVSSTGWLIYGYQLRGEVEYTKCFDSNDIFTTLSQYKQKFG